MKKLILFGDSMLGHFGCELIQKVESETSVDIYNCAMGGATTEDGLKKALYIASLKPDIVLLSFGTNDIFKKNLSASDFLKNLTQIIDLFKGSRVIVWFTPKANDINDVEGTLKFNSQILRYNDEVRKYCEVNKIEFIDSFSDYKIEVGTKDIYHEDDGIHLVDTGYEPFISSLVRILNN